MLGVGIFGWFVWPGTPTDTTPDVAETVAPLLDTPVPAETVTAPDTQSEDDDTPDADAPVVKEETKATSEDDRMVATILGKWETERNGHRDLEVRDDGTATMKVQVTNFARFMLGSKLRLDIEWHIASGVLHMKTVGGEPADKIDLIKSSYGESLAYNILKLTKERLLVEDGDGAPDHDWTRVKDQAGEKPADPEDDK